MAADASPPSLSTTEQCSFAKLGWRAVDLHITLILSGNSIMELLNEWILSLIAQICFGDVG